MHLCFPILGITILFTQMLPPLAGTNPPRPGIFPDSPGPVAEVYGTPSQDSAGGRYISAASPQPGSGFGHSIAVSTKQGTICFLHGSDSLHFHLIFIF